MNKSNKLVGVLGGMGPAATVDFMVKVIASTDAERDQDHVRMLIDHNPQVPNRQDAILAGGESPGPVLAAMAARLETNGVDFLVMPCNSAYVFAGDILAATTIPLVSIITESIAAIRDCRADARSVGIMATDGCLDAGIYQAGIAASGMTAVLPDADEVDALMLLIKSIKSGTQDTDAGVHMARLAAALVARGADAIIAGCTEIPIVLRENAVDVPLIASTDALAAKTVRLATGAEPLPDRK